MKKSHVLLALFAGAVFGSSVQSAGGFFNRAMALLVQPADLQVGTGAVWTGVGPNVPVVWNQADRIFTGNAANNIPSTRVGTNSTWLNSTAAGPSWIPRDAQFIAMTTYGNIAVAGAAKASQGAGVSGGTAAIGLAGFTISDLDNKAAWASYLECQIEAGANRNCYGAEVEVKNKGANVVPSPFSMGAFGHGLWVGAGGDSSYGGPPANPSTSAVSIIKNSSTWNSGITIQSTAITGCDGTTATTCAAVKTAIGQGHCWYVSGGASGCINGDAPDASHVVLNIPQYTPPTSSQSCRAGDVSWDAGFVYVCTSTNTWARSTLSAF